MFPHGDVNTLTDGASHLKYCVYTTFRYAETMHNRLALIRRDQQLSRHDLAEAVQVNPQTIGYLERGDYKPSLELALKIARVFDLPVEMIFSLDPFQSFTDVLRRTGAQS